MEIVEALDYDFSDFDEPMMLMGSVLRTRMHDRWLESWLAEHPAGTVVEIGAGLNTRFERVDNGQLHWVDLDLPDAASSSPTPTGAPTSRRPSPTAAGSPSSTTCPGRRTS